MKRLVAVAIAIALVAPGLALAGISSTCQAYNPQTCNVSRAVSSSSLPFTGLDIVLLVVGGAGLTCVGLLARRLSRHAE
jgi:hypothetical protein